jgi:glycopeptide antibiotics resistance protein
MKFDYGYITKYILEYDIGVPAAIIIGVSLSICVIILLQFRVKSSYSNFAKKASLCLFIGYVFLVLCTTLFYREETYERHYMIRPLWSYMILDNRLFAQIIMNVLLFIPIGLFAGGTFKKKHIWHVIGIGFILSFFIELTQLISTRGVFSVDDIIHNVLGCTIGYGIYRLCKSILTASTK